MTDLKTKVEQLQREALSMRDHSKSNAPLWNYHDGRFFAFTDVLSVIHAHEGETTGPVHVCEDWRMEGMGCRHCNPLAKNVWNIDQANQLLTACRALVTQWREEANTRRVNVPSGLIATVTWTEAQSIDECADALDAILKETSRPR